MYHILQVVNTERNQAAAVDTSITQETRAEQSGECPCAKEKNDCKTGYFAMHLTQKWPGPHKRARLMLLMYTPDGLSRSVRIPDSVPALEQSRTPDQAERTRSEPILKDSNGNA